MEKVYIAGPITGDPNYKEKFAAVAEELRKLGLEPINPAKDAPEGMSYREYIDRGIRLLMDCDIICGIATSPRNPDKRQWPPESNGARLELLYASTVGMPLMQAEMARGEKGPVWIIEIRRCWPGMFGGSVNGKNTTTRL